MKPLLFTLIILFFFGCSHNIIDDSKDLTSGIVSGNNIAFGISAPDGWVLDNTSGASQGLYAVFYPKGGSWKYSEAVMYVNTVSKAEERYESLSKLVSYDSTKFTKDDSEMVVKVSDTLTTHDKKKAIVKLYIYSQYEAVAYINEESTIAMAILSSRNKKSFDSSLPAFKQLVESYFFISKSVQIQR